MGVEWYGEDVQRQVLDAVEHSLDIVASNIEQDCRQSMEYIGSGIDYTPGSGDERAEWMPAAWRKRFKVRSSAPGDPPVKQTGGVQQTIHIEKQGRFTRLIGSRDPIFFWLETGTKKMLPRPSLIPAVYRQIGGRAEFTFKSRL